MLDGFCEYLRQQGKSENTVKAYSQGMKDYMRWYEEPNQGEDEGEGKSSLSDGRLLYIIR